MVARLKALPTQSRHKTHADVSLVSRCLAPLHSGLMPMASCLNIWITPMSNHNGVEGANEAEGEF